MSIKNEWAGYDFDNKEYSAKVKSLPEGHRKAYKEISKYIWEHAVDQTQTMDALIDILDMFTENKDIEVTEFIGEDIIGFCDNMIAELPQKSWEDKKKQKLNTKISKKINT